MLKEELKDLVRKDENWERFTETIVRHRFWHWYLKLLTNSLFSSQIVTRHCTRYKLSWPPPPPPTSSWWSRWRPQCWCRSWCPRCRWRRRWQRRSTCLSGQNCKKCHKYLEIWQIQIVILLTRSRRYSWQCRPGPRRRRCISTGKRIHTRSSWGKHTIVSRILEEDIWTVSGTDREYGPRQLQSWSISLLVWCRYYLIQFSISIWL